MLSNATVVQAEDDARARRGTSYVQHRHPNLERLICAAVSNKRLANQLLRAPSHLAECGYHVELSPTESALLESIHGARDIYDFAAKLYRRIREV